MSDPRKSGTTESKYRVLVADDEAPARKMLAVALTGAGFSVTEAIDGKELYEILTTAPSGYFRLVVTDHAMPHLAGVEVLAHAGARAPFVVVTGYDSPALRDAAARFGARAVIRKPIDIARFLETVDEIVFGATVPARPGFRGHGDI